ncbi:hypothetical protein C8T65DRAFT_178316 [Cerioporus squamosus]|nr:hypothetical protein C8T65DRAFT_178316 [Cerioporus squamosus]
MSQLTDMDPFADDTASVLSDGGVPPSQEEVQPLETAATPHTAAEPAEPSVSTPSKARKTRTSTASSAADKGKGKPGDVPDTHPGPAALPGGQQRLETPLVPATQLRQAWGILQRDLRRVEDRLDTVDGQQNTVHDTLLELVTASHTIRDTVANHASIVAVVREHDDRLAIMSREMEDEEELRSRETTGFNQQNDTILGGLQDLTSKVSDLSGSLDTIRQDVHTLQAARATTFLPPAAPVAPAAPGAPAALAAPAAPALPQLPPAPAPYLPPAPQMGGSGALYRPSDVRNPRPYKKRAMAPPRLTPTAPAMPVAGPVPPMQVAPPHAFQPAPPPMPLPGRVTDHPAIVRFGRVQWSPIAVTLRQQIYAVGRAAWDAYPGLFPSITDVSLQHDEPEQAEITFPSYELARTFVDAWQRNRVSAGEWRRLQVHLL